MKEVKKIERHEKPLGASGTDVIGKVHNADDHIEALQGYQAAQFYDRMRRSDTQVRKVLGAINNPIRSAHWKIEAASTDEADVKSARLIEQILFHDIKFSKFLNEVLTMVPHGYSMFEVVHQNKVDDEIGSYTGLAQLGFRKQTTITEWRHDEITGELLSVEQTSNSDIKVNAEIPAKFLLIFYSEQEGDNIGFPLCRALYGPYKRKLLATELQYIGIERFAIPTPLLEVPNTISQSDEEYIEAVEVLKNFTSAEDSYITYPKGWTLTLHNNVFNPEQLKSVIKAEDEAMSGAILATFLELGIGGNGGAFALGSDLSDFFLSGIEYFADTITDTINRELIPSLIKLNYGDAKIALPRLVYSGISDKAGKELMEIVTGYKNAGLISADEPLEDHLREVHNLPPKAIGEMLDNGGSENDEMETQAIDEGPSVEDDVNNSDSDSVEPDNVGLGNGVDVNSIKLAEIVGHVHDFNGLKTGPAIQRGQKHYHDLLDADGEVVGRTKVEASGQGHVHWVNESEKTGRALQVKLADEPEENPKKLIEQAQDKILQIIRFNLGEISDKYIADVINKYKTLPPSRKLEAINGIKIGGVNRFKKELKAALTGAARASDELVRSEIPSKAETKLKSDMDAIRLEFENADNFKFNDFSKLPKRIQILIANTAQMLTDKEAKEIADTVAFQFTSSEASTNDVEVLRKDLKDAASGAINSGTKETVALNAAATMVNETRNMFILSPEVAEGIASYTFVNYDPKTEICKTLAGTTYDVNDQDLVRYQPPLHHNCKSYLRPNLKTTANKPDVTGLPPISEAAKKSITLSEDK